MATYAFILFVLNPSGEYSSFVLDYNLTKEDCSELQNNWANTVDQYSTVYCMPEQGE